MYFVVFSDSKITPHLSQRKLLPALFNLFEHNLLPEKFKIKHKALIDPTYYDSIIAGMARVCKPGGTAGRTGIEGIAICAKTGTAQIAQPGGGYYPDRFLHSFFGYFPAFEWVSRRPRNCCKILYSRL